MRRLVAVSVVCASLLAMTSPVANADLNQRIAAAEQYLAARPGTVAFVLRDRVTGGKYRNANAGKAMWTASTIKLAMVADLLSREQAEQIRLSDADRRQMVAMLRSSDNAAADALWFRYGGTDQVFNANFARYGMPNIRPQSGFGDVYPYWGFQKGTADDFDGLMNYVLTGLAPGNVAAVVAEMQRVDGDQQWGVWGAGTSMTPGNKNGWSQEQGGYDEGVETTTRLAQILLG